jgi:putative iron-dependent peroxidase
MKQPQPGILADVPVASRYLFFSPRFGGDVRASMLELAARSIDESLVIGIGAPTLAALGVQVEGLRVHPSLVGAGISVPSTQAGLWLWLRGQDRGELLHRSRDLADALVDGFELDDIIEGFRHGEGRDLSGYVDGTENPRGEDAIAAAFGPDRASFVAVQRWIHDLDHLEAMDAEERDATIGRRLSDNEEIDEAPLSAHVKRTAQESFSPPAFVLRRSVPWSDPDGEGLLFVAFGRTFDAYEALLQRMIGLEDGISDALFRFTRPVSGSYFWCPPVADGRLALGF